MLCIEYYILERNLDGINTLGEYTKRFDNIDLTHSIPYDELVEIVARI